MCGCSYLFGKFNISFNCQGHYNDSFFFFFLSVFPFEKILFVCKVLRNNSDVSLTASSYLLASTHANTLHSLNRHSNNDSGQEKNNNQKLLHNLEVKHHIMVSLEQFSRNIKHLDRIFVFLNIF